MESTPQNPSPDSPHSPPDFRPAADAVARLLHGVADGQLGEPTPCPDYTVRELLGHLAGLSAAFRDTALKNLGPTTDTPPDSARPVLDDDWRTVLPERLGALAAAWAGPEAWEGMTRAGGVTLPAEVAGQVALNELVVHGWDLARATGQPYGLPEASLRVSYELLAAAGDDDTLRGTNFGPAVAVAKDTPLLERVIGLSGRDPGWSPGAAG
ncbi:TIGR03086 family metal-binding protein [Streptomyces qinzhouensis]|uniref:TIGR03086 family protein n=1 Tax=Streptomyces qinzhouensis TaxID=2599401 RepID=A0A5B8IM85_9ACTN|nr:TIGR03086 family metal-binding protein [Streptomyces qinzhouensis]QDY79718.1 TIGR03086 family protein [Streptomyces qinzhouensis]